MNADLNDRLSRLATHLDAERTGGGRSTTTARVDEPGTTWRRDAPVSRGAERPRRASALVAAAAAVLALIAVAVVGRKDSDSTLRTADDSALADSGYISVAVTAQVDPPGSAALENLDTPFEAIPRAGVYQISFSLDGAAGELATARVGPWQTKATETAQPNVLANQQGGCENAQVICNVDSVPIIDADDWNVVPLFFDAEALPLGTTDTTSVITFADAEPITMTVQLDVSPAAAPPEHEEFGTTTSTEPTSDTVDVADCEERAATFLESGADIFLYLHPEAAQTDIDALLSKIEGNEHVRQFWFYDQAEMLSQFQAVYSDHPALVDSVTAQALPSLVQVDAAAGDALIQVSNEVADDRTVREVLGREDVTRAQAEQCNTLKNPGRILSPSTTTMVGG
jgi:FtsX extracellular domain